MGMKSELSWGRDMGHKFQPALLAPNSYICSHFPVFLILFPVRSYSTRPPPPPHCHRPERQRSSPSSPSRAFHEVQSSLSTQGVGLEDGGKLGENRIEVKLQRSPSQEPMDIFSQLFLLISNMSWTMQLAALTVFIFIFVWLTEHKMHFHKTSVEVKNKN